MFTLMHKIHHHYKYLHMQCLWALWVSISHINLPNSDIYKQRCNEWFSCRIVLIQKSTSLNLLCVCGIPYSFHWRALIHKSISVPMYIDNIMNYAEDILGGGDLVHKHLDWCIYKCDYLTSTRIVKEGSLYSDVASILPLT